MHSAAESRKRKKILIISQLVILLIAFLIADAVTPVVNSKIAPVLKSFYPEAYVNITLSNNQSVPTLENFDQLIKIDWAMYRDYLNPNASNVRIFNSTHFNTTHELAAWIEDNDSVAASSSNVWVNLEDTIVPAKGTVNIYMLFLSPNYTWDTYWGEA